MAIYVFNLLVGYLPCGVDYSLGYREQLLKDSSYTFNYIFTELPGRKEINFYRGLGINIAKMLSVHQYFTDNQTLELSVDLNYKLKELKNNLCITEVKYRENRVLLLKENCALAEILLDENDKNYISGVNYYNKGKLVRTEIYTSELSYVNYYVTAKANGGSYAKLVRRTFYNCNGVIAYEQIFEGNKEWYIFPDGMVYTKSQFIAEFIKKLNLSKHDTVLLHRSAQFDFVQPLFQFGKKARFITFLHSEHFFDKGEDPFECNINLNWEYLYWIKYTNLIDTMIVSTQEQKERLLKKLEEYQCFIPAIEVIPTGGIDCLRYPETVRKPFSIISASRIVSQKKIDWIIKSVIKAHQFNSSISLDIYGTGDKRYINYLKNIVSESDAHTYIHFMGHTDVSEVYKNYEVYIAASLYETFGSSVMKAAGSGVAVIGLDVRYGNRLFIHSGKNGYLIDFDWSYIDNDELIDKVINQMAEKIVEIFANKERLEQFHQNSYEIARHFSAREIKEKWENLLAK